MAQISYFGRDICGWKGDEAEEEESVQEYGPSDDGQEVVEFGEEQVVQGVTVAWNVTHVVEEYEWLPEVVGLVHQFAHLVVLVV